jgi:outer membrane protein TolC
MRFIFLFLLVSIPASAETIDNLSVQGQSQALESEKVRQGFLGRSFVPSLSLDLGQEQFQTGRYRHYSNPYGMLEARLNLFRGGRDTIESAIRDLNVKSAEQNRTAVVRQELNKVRKIQFMIIYNYELVKILEEEFKQNKKIQLQAEKRGRSGVASRSDALEFIIYNSELEEGIESLKHENKILKISLLPLLNLTTFEGLKFQDSLVHEHDDELIAKNFESKKHPGVVAKKNEFESYQLKKKSTGLWWTPSLDLYGGYYLYTLRDRDYLSQSARDDQVIGARITFELFDGMKSLNEKSAAHYQAQAKNLEAQYLEKKTDAQYQMLKEDLMHTHEVMHYVQDRIQKSKDYLRITLDEYNRGVKNSLDALTAMQRYYRYEKQYLEKKKEYQTIKADILAIRGE